MSRHFLHTVAALAVCSAVAHAQAPDPIAPTVDSIATRALAATGVPSASVAVVQHGQLIYAHAYGNAKLDPATPATTSMRYAIGSISKQFTAAAVMLLVQEGKISLDDKVEKWVPGLTRGNEVTIRQILSHTSGYQDFWPQDYVPPAMTKPIAPSAILAHWAKQPLDFDPGSRWQYSNTNYTIAALAIEKASGMPFFQFIRTRLLQPLGITDAVDFDAGGPNSIEPEGYLRYALGPLRPAIPTGPGWMFGAGELALTPTDLAKWDIAMIDRTLLAPSSWQTMETSVTLNNGVTSGYGLGLFMFMSNGHHLIEHNGEVSGFLAENFVLPEDSIAVVALTNQDASSAAGQIANQVARALLARSARRDTLTGPRTAQARAIFEGLMKGTIDRSLFTPDANAYFSAQALADFASGLAPLGTVTSFEFTGSSLRGGMTERNYRVTMSNGQTLRAWTFELPDGKLEQYQVSP